MKYDIAVIGAGLGGWLLAKKLSLTQNVILLEASFEDGGWSHTSLDFVPATNDGSKLIGGLEEILETKLNSTSHEVPAIAFEKGNFIPHVGFGERSPLDVDEISYYTGANRLEFDLPVHEWIPKLRDSYFGKLTLKARITKFEIQDGRVLRAIVNGESVVEADKFIFSACPTELQELIPVVNLDNRVRQRLAKAKLWETLSITLHHDRVVSEKENIHVLVGTGETPRVCIGAFRRSENPKAQTSTWMTLLSSEDCDEEMAANALREMRRQIEKAYPTALRDIIDEKVVLSGKSHGSIPLKLEKNQTLPGLSNLYVSSPFLSSEKNILGVIESALSVLKAISQPTASPRARDTTISV